MKDVRDALMVARTSDGRLVRRPLSPHLQIYRPQMSTVLSITHRATGIALSVGTLLLAWWLIAAASSDAAFATVQGFMRSPIGLVLLFGWSVSLVYHTLAGIRHLIWDAGYGYGIGEFHRSGWTVVALTGVLTVLLWIVGLIMLGRS